MSGTVFGSRIRSSVSTFAFAALVAAAPMLAAGAAGAATIVPASPTAPAPAATTDSTTATPAPKVEQKADQKAEGKSVTKAEGARTETQGQAAPATKQQHQQVAATPKAEVTKAQADAVAKELGAKPTEQLSVQLGKYHEQILAAHALKDGAARDKAVAEARQQLAAIGGKPVTAEQAAKIDGILGVKTSTTIQ
ncbi:hypothetical protein [Azospirillum picis]|uniref:Uncharacterized protein n=1 Tax=Azospirillum picis TaxID=488438 RepID=A0ABU0MIY2_9PROT|nr:hypothetical protein [Azospirillum picis]MBP2299447.1 hypothetical protein [Azospirillum picis]MDQ0533426.1 hypothetical protein [Azospirillum picis]